jgi:rhodanese-related sulfurtransferase
VYGAIFRFDGQASVFYAPRGPCYRCLYPEPPPPDLVPSCAEGGVLGALPGIVGSLQALETLKIILGVGEPLIGRLLLLDGLRLRFRELSLRKDPACPVCSERPTLRELIDYEAFCGTGANGDEAAEVSVRDLAAQWVMADRPLLVDVREPFELEICRLEGALAVPLGELPARLGELDSHREIVTVCHRGHRSLRARDILRAAGFPRVKSLRGGLDAWAIEIDPSMERY